MATYSNTSPWANTTISNNYLNILKIRPVSAEADDAIYTIEPQYNHRPDLLAHDLMALTSCGGFLYNAI